MIIGTPPARDFLKKYNIAHPVKQNKSTQKYRPLKIGEKIKIGDEWSGDSKYDKWTKCTCMCERTFDKNLQCQYRRPIKTVKYRILKNDEPIQYGDQYYNTKTRG